jgi:hypothetical protein
VELIQQHRRFGFFLLLFLLFLFFFFSSPGIFSRVLGVGDRVNWKVIGFWMAAEEEGEGEKGVGGGR